MNKLVKLGHKVINEFENKEIPFYYYLLTFLFAINLRDFLELFSDRVSFDILYFMHYNMYYVSIGLSLILLFYFATKEDIMKISRVILPSFLVLLLTPLLDLVISLGKGYHLAYINFSNNGQSILIKYLTFFGRFNGIGVTYGQRIEIALILIASFIYFFIKNKNLIKSLFFTFLEYTIIFLSGVMPLYIELFFKVINISTEYSPENMMQFYLIFSFFIGLILFAIAKTDYLIELVKDIRIFRVMHYILMFVFGMLLVKIYNPIPFMLHQDIIYDVILVIISIILACIFSLITNNFADYKIDLISNKNRPLVSKSIPKNVYNVMAWVVLVLAILSAAYVNLQTMFFILVFIGVYFLYSMPPLRLKRVPFVSKFMIAFNALLFIMMGYYYFLKTVFVPFEIIAYFLVFFTLAINVIDIKDYEGDKVNNIMTLPTLLGLKVSKHMIGFFVLLAYIMPYFMFDFVKQSHFFILFFAGLIQYFLINRKNYVEQHFFAFYIFTLVIGLGYLAIL